MGEERTRANLLREATHFQLVEVKDFLQSHCAGQPIDAKNPMCYRVVVSQLWEKYLKWCREYSYRSLNRSEFILAVEWVFPSAKLSEWRVIDGKKEREFDGIIASYRQYKPTQSAIAYTAERE